MYNMNEALIEWSYMIAQTNYLKKLKIWQEQQVIKVITGIRRCGKSTLLQLFQEQLMREGVDKSRIISLNFEDLANEPLLDYRKLYQHILSHLDPEVMTYIFLDEVQLVPDFQKAVDSIYIRKNVDLYLTGSNAWLLSGELATLLSGRYVEINMLPLSFADYYENQTKPADEAFANYMRWGGFPFVVLSEYPERIADEYLEGIYNTIIIKDIELRQTRREKDPDKRKITDLALLKNIAKFLANSVGNPISDKKAADFITSTGRRISQNTVSDYIDALIEPYVFYPAERFDVIGKQLLKQNRKLYIADIGLRNHIVPRSGFDLGFVLENIVFLELRRRGFQVNVGKAGGLEIDFAVRKDSELNYFQVTASMTEKSTFDREMASLLAVRDNYPKTILTLDRFTAGNYNGIRVINAVDWLLDKV